MSRAASSVILALALPGLGISMTGCTSSADTLGLDTSTAGSARSAALNAAGPLQGEVIHGRACFWVTTDSGAEVALVWPPGSVARENPLRVESSTGELVAESGTSTSSLSGNPDEGAGCRPGSTRFIVGPVD